MKYSSVLVFLLASAIFSTLCESAMRKKRFLGCVTIVDCFVTFKRIIPFRFNFNIKIIYHRIKGALKGCSTSKICFDFKSPLSQHFFQDEMATRNLSGSDSSNYYKIESTFLNGAD